MSRRINFNENVDIQKQCVSGPNVKFNAGAIHYKEYLQNLKNRGSLDCHDKFPKYTNGKYCCEDTMSTDQEQLDYINNLFQNGIFENMDLEAFIKEKDNIQFLISKRNQLLFSNAILEDNLIVPNNITLDEWFDNMNGDAISFSRIGRQMRFPPEGMNIPRTSPWGEGERLEKMERTINPNNRWWLNKGGKRKRQQKTKKYNKKSHKNKKTKKRK